MPNRPEYDEHIQNSGRPDTQTRKTDFEAGYRAGLFSINAIDKAEIKRLRTALIKITNGNPTCDSPEAQLIENQSLAFGALNAHSKEDVKDSVQ